MMHFLEVGSMREDLVEILKNAQLLRQLLAMSHAERQAIDQHRARLGELSTVSEEIQASLQAILARSAELIAFLDRFESSPLIYTGEGSTEAVLAKLQRLMAIARELGEEL
jgi:hypothetical protein